MSKYEEGAFDDDAQAADLIQEYEARIAALERLVGKQALELEFLKGVEFYGYRRVGAALRQQGLVIYHKKIRRLMRQHDLHPKIRRRFVATTDSNHDGLIFPNLAKDIVPTGPNQLWVSDITYVALPTRFICVAVVLMPGHG